MKISLRKANALQNSIQDHLKTIATTLSISLNEFQDPERELVAARNEFSKSDTRRVALTKALYYVRAQVGRANVESGVSDLLAQAAFNDKRLATLKAIVEGDVTESMDVVRGKLRKIAEDKSDRRIYSYDSTVTVGVLTAQHMDEFKSEMLSRKKEKQSINDKILELNVRTEIELDAETVSVLQNEQLV